MSKTALESALDLLARRSLTSREVVERLEKKGFMEQEITESIDRLREWGYLNDYSYAVSYCRAYIKREPRQKIYYKLVRKGIESSMANEAIETVHSLEQEIKLCSEFARKIWNVERERWNRKYPDQKGYEQLFPKDVMKQKVGSKLWRKGFTFEIINRCLDELS